VLAVTAINLTEATMKKADHKKAAFAFTQSAIVIYFLHFLLNPANPKAQTQKAALCRVRETNLLRLLGVSGQKV
jgi:hypothetical protein